MLTLTLFSMMRITEGQSLITGKTVDSVSLQPLESPSVSELDTASKTLTDQYGNFNLIIHIAHL